MPTPTELPLNGTSAGSRHTRADSVQDELSKLKHELLQAEVRLAKSRAGMVGAEADVKVLTARLRAFTK